MRRISLVSFQLAARITGFSLSTLETLVDAGVLVPHVISGRRFLDRYEVMGLRVKERRPLCG